MTRVIGLLSLLGAFTFRDADAQMLSSARAGLSQTVNPTSSRPASRLRVAAESDTYWKEGMVIGGAAGAIIGYAVESIGLGLGDDPNARVSLSSVLIATIAGAILGGLLGSGKHK